MRKSIRAITITVILAFLAFVGIRMINAPTNLELIETYELPTFPKISDLLSEPTEGRTAIAIDGQIVYTNDSEIQPTASTAKMITALAVMQKKPFPLGEPGETITITPEFYDLYAWYLSHNGSVSAVITGEEISEYDALASMLLVSSNNLADTLAIWAFGSLENYRAYATTMLQDFGFTSTTIGIDASGYDESTTSTPEDLALIGQKILENPVLAKIVGTKNYEVPVAGLLENTNQLLGESGIIGIKTGYIGEPSGYCLVTGYREDATVNERSPFSHIITIAALNTETRASSFEVSKVVIDELQAKFQPTIVAASGTEVGYYDSWWSGRISITLNQDLTVLGWDTTNTSENLQMTDYDGTLNVKIGNSDYSASIKTTSELNLEPTFLDRLQHALFLK